MTTKWLPPVVVWSVERSESAFTIQKVWSMFILCLIFCAFDIFIYMPHIMALFIVLKCRFKVVCIVYSLLLSYSLFANILLL